MRFTVCIPTYNRAHTLRKPLNSLVEQSFKDFEVLIIDDGSTDSTPIVVNDYLDKLNIQYIKKENGGKHTALNVGIKKAQGDFFIILDSDDSLRRYALETFATLWSKVERDPTICGIMGRCAENGNMIGIPFKNANRMSYVEFHYGRNGGKYRDCCECLKTSIIKKYSWPENGSTRFIPENYVTDKIGLNYSLYLTDEILEDKEYLENDGITKNVHEYRRKNHTGYLINYISKITEILPYTNEVVLTNKVKIWMGYWEMLTYDADESVERLQNISFLGFIAYFLNIANRWRKHG